MDVTAPGRVRAALGADLRSYARTPVLLALLVAVPAYVVVLFPLVAPDTAVPLEVDGATVTATLPEAVGTVTAPLAASLVAGITGLFLMGDAAVDGRLALAGFRGREVVAARFGVLVAVGSLASGVAVAGLAPTVVPAHPAWFLVAVLLAALCYGLAGVLAGTLLDRLPGTYLLLFGPSLDLFLLQNPLTDPPAVAEYLPTHYAVSLATEAALADSVTPGELGPALAGVAVLGALAVAAFASAMRS
jgi:hypothetical protein